jgi:hypothetical protein
LGIPAAGIGDSEEMETMRYPLDEAMAQKAKIEKLKPPFLSYIIVVEITEITIFFSSFPWQFSTVEYEDYEVLLLFDLSTFNYTADVATATAILSFEVVHGLS